MPIPYRDLRESENPGFAGFLRFAGGESARTIHGALFLINARGEPIDFTVSSIDVPASFLWGGGEARRNATASLVAALFEACPRTPLLLLALAREVHPALFTDDILVDVPICLVADHADLVSQSDLVLETVLTSIHLFWVGTPPKEESPARAVLESLLARQLLTEPFDRAAQGIEESQRE